MAGSKSIVTLNFAKVLEGAVPGPSDVLDMRNLIYVRGLKLTLETYFNYLELIKPYAMAAKGCDYMLRLGFIPLIMPPSVLQETLHTEILKHLPRELPHYPRPAVGFRNPKFSSDYPDVWVSKLDAAEFCGCKPEDVTVKGVLMKCIKK